MSQDIYIFDTLEGGDITLDLEMRDGLEGAAYLSLFGGNSKDDGSEKTPFQWWGNLIENEPSRVYRAETAYLLATAPPTSNNLRRIEDAARRDLNWFITDGYATQVNVVASMPKLNTVHLKIEIDGLDPLEFKSSWGIVLQETPGSGQTIAPPVVSQNTLSILSGLGLPRATLVLEHADGTTETTQIDETGKWSFIPSPLGEGEVAKIYVLTTSGQTSQKITVVGVRPLVYDGSWKFDGSQQYNGVKK